MRNENYFSSKRRIFFLFNIAITLSIFTGCVSFTKKTSEMGADAYYNRGIAYHKKGQYNRAIQDYDKAIEINPQYADAYNNRGVVYLMKLGDGDKEKGRAPGRP